jgi:hypothetical protein
MSYSAAAVAEHVATNFDDLKRRACALALLFLSAQPLKRSPVVLLFSRIDSFLVGHGNVWKTKAGYPWKDEKSGVAKHRLAMANISF